MKECYRMEDDIIRKKGVTTSQWSVNQIGETILSNLYRALLWGDHFFLSFIILPSSNALHLSAFKINSPSLTVFGEAVSITIILKARVVCQVYLRVSACCSSDRRATFASRSQRQRVEAGLQRCTNTTKMVKPTTLGFGSR